LNERVGALHDQARRIAANIVKLPAPLA